MSDEQRPAPGAFPDLPRPITSFGAGVLDGAVYVYGGHHGKAHHYDRNGQSGTFLRLDLAQPGAWHELPSGPALAGLAMVSHAGKLYRLGGFEARNTVDEEQDLWSLADCVAYDPAKEAWQELPPLPQPRSSFAAAVLDGTLYVVGGWTLAGAAEAVWQTTAARLRPDVADAAWEELAVPFQRRALSLGTAGGKLYAIGGMSSAGSVTSATAVFDPDSAAWSEGPPLPEDEMEGFGTAACTSAGRLYVSTASGRLLRLSADGAAFETVGRLQQGRFFHGLLPLADDRFLVLGGASMRSGKFSSLEQVAAARSG